jgi:hypothetical protein
MAFTYYDNNDYTVWLLDKPHALTQTTQQAVIAQDSTPKGVDSAQTSISRSVYSNRPSSGAQQDTTGASNVAALLADPNTGLPDTLTFKKYPYSIRFTPDYVLGGSIGVAGGGGYGTTFGGGTTLVFSDLTGDHELAVGAGVYGRLADASLLVGYGDFSHRLQYSAGAAQDVAYINTGAQQIPLAVSDPNIAGVRDQYIFTRYELRTAAVTGAYPLNRFTRFELGASINFIGRDSVAQNYDLYYDNSGNFLGENVNFQTLRSLPTLHYVAPILAFVSDNTLTGVTGPIDGRRMRFSVSPAFGNIRWTEYGADYRRYDPVIFNTLTFSTRLFADFTAGRDENLFPKYIGTPDFVRGYDQSSFYSGYSCDSFLGTVNTLGRACSTVQLVGTRVAVVNEELRFPIIRRFDFGSLPVGLPPVDGQIFYDAGLAWSAGQSVSLTKPANYDYTIQRYVLRSYGFGFRVNLFNLAILRWDLAKPLDRPDNNKWNWTFSLGPSF